MFKAILVIFVTICCSGGVLSQEIDIEDGLEAYDGVFPWTTHVEILDDITMEYIIDCFGIIIAPSWVYVPATCVARTYHTYRLNFGNVNFTQSEISMISRTSFIHPQFNESERLSYNGALIELPIPLSFTGTISPITLPFNINEEEIYGTEAYFIGRRRMINPLTEISHTIVRWNRLEIISDEHCNTLDPGSFSTQLCALGTEENPTKTPCSALGHLAIYNNSKYILIGGGGNPAGGNSICHRTPYPSFFTRVSMLLEWITDTTGVSE